MTKWKRKQMVLVVVVLMITLVVLSSCDGSGGVLGGRMDVGRMGTGDEVPTPTSLSQ